MRRKEVCLDELCSEADRLRSAGVRIAATSGCFDILHAGHVAYLEEARTKAGALVVMLNSDRSVRSLKGIERPIVPQRERAQVLCALENVDYVCIFDGDTPCAAYARFRPDIVIKGGDYVGRHIPEMDVLATWGGHVEYAGLTEGCSSTNIIEKIKRLAGGGK